MISKIGNSTITRSRFLFRLTLCGAIAPFVLAAFIVWAGIVTPGYSHISETVSQLGAWHRPYPEVMNSGFVVFGLLIGGFAYGLYLKLGKGTGARVVLALLLTYAAGIILAGIFRDDPAALEEATLGAILHSIFAQVAFWGLTLGMMVFSRTTYKDIYWKGFQWFSSGIIIFNLLSSMVFLMKFAGPIEGLLQRSFYAISLLWIEAVSIRTLLR